MNAVTMFKWQNSMRTKTLCFWGCCRVSSSHHGPKGRKWGQDTCEQPCGSFFLPTYWLDESMNETNWNTTSLFYLAVMDYNYSSKWTKNRELLKSMRSKSMSLCWITVMKMHLLNQMNNKAMHLCYCCNGNELHEKMHRKHESILLL